ncbi:PSS-domain-containing protein [Clavulina sp. PMI_390]|nr:PSS-domain-containing protein [Clavulina sp. PMI_390]
MSPEHELVMSDPDEPPSPTLHKGTLQDGTSLDPNESYANITPFAETSDPSVEFFFKPATLTTLGVGLAILAYVAMSADVLEEGVDKRRVGAIAAIVAFLSFSMIQFRDGPYVRPHPAFWRVALGLNLLYELALVFLLFQDLPNARLMMKSLDPSLGVPLAEKSYAEDCSLTPRNLWNAIDIFCLAHALGWFGKALILRDYWFCWILSVAFELAEYSLAHQCWWDHWVLDVLLCNWAGIELGMRTCAFFEVKQFVWRGFRETKGLRRKSKRLAAQLTPRDWTTFKWEGTQSFAGYVAVVTLLTMFLTAELNVFYLKTLLWMEPDHPFVIIRLAAMFLCALPATAELYQYMHETKTVVRMGQHAWLMSATVFTELLIIFKFGRDQFPQPFPLPVKVFITTGLVVLATYPILKFGLPKMLGTTSAPGSPVLLRRHSITSSR